MLSHAYVHIHTYVKEVLALLATLTPQSRLYLAMQNKFHDLILKKGWLL